MFILIQSETEKKKKSGYFLAPTSNASHLYGQVYNLWVNTFTHIRQAFAWKVQQRFEYVFDHESPASIKHSHLRRMHVALTP